MSTFGLWDWPRGREAFVEVTLRFKIDKEVWDLDILLVSPVGNWPLLPTVTVSS